MSSRFFLEIANKPVLIEGESMLLGNIQIGDFKEGFRCPASYWSREDYLHQWQEGLSRLKEGHERSAIVTEMYDPSLANYINWWIFYSTGGGGVFIQNHILFMSDITGNFSEKSMYEFIPNRETETEDGERLSEWNTSLSDIEMFLTS